MAMTSSANEYFSPRETGKTKDELNWLKKLIGDKDKKQSVDNINFDEKFKDKGLNDKVFDKIKTLDKTTDNLFDAYMIEKQNIIKDILGWQGSTEEKRDAIKMLFKWFLSDIQDPEKIKNYKNNEDLSDKITSFNTIFESFKEEIGAETKTVIALSQLELNYLKDEILSLEKDDILNSETTINNQWNTGWYWYYHGAWVKHASESDVEENETKISRIKNKRNNKDKGIKNDFDVVDKKSNDKTYAPINDVILYRGESYLDIDEDDWDLPENTPEKRALKKLLNGKEPSLLLVDQNFKPTGSEKKLLKELRGTINAIWLDSFGDAIKEVKKIYFQQGSDADRTGEEENIAKLGVLFTAAMEPSNDYPYFSRVIKLFSEEFIKNPNTTFVEIYNTLNNSKSKKELWLAKENRNMFQRALNTHGKAFDILEQTNGSLDKQAAKELSKRNKKLNINKVIENNMKRVEESRSEWYEDEVMKGRGEEAEFIAFLVEQLEPVSFSDGKKNHLYEVLLGETELTLPSQEAFLHLLNATRLGTNIEQYANATNTYKEAKEVTTLEGKQEKFVNMLTDLDRNGRVDFGDGAVRTWLQLRSYYNTAIDEVGEENVISNLIDVAISHANTKNFKNYTKILETIKWQPDYTTKLDRFIDEFRDPGFVKFLQTVLLESPLDTDLLLTQGNNAFKHYTEMIDWLKEQDKKLIYNYINEQLKDYDVDPIIKEGLFQAIATPLIQAKQQWLGAGVRISLDNLLQGLSLNVGTWFVGDTPTLLGIHLARNKNFNLDKDTSIYTGTSLGLVNGFIPVASIGGGVEKWITNKNKKTLDAASAKKVAIGPNLTLIGWIVPAIWVTAGFGVDKMKGIEDQSEYIRDWVKPIVQEFLKNYNQLDWTKEDSIKMFKKILQKQFGNSDPETIEKAANNMYTALTYFGFTDSDRKSIQENIWLFSSLVADFYVTNRTNEQILGLNRWHFSNASLWVQFLAWYYPIPTVCIQIAKYKNLYFKDTKESIQRNTVAETTWFWNEFKNIENYQGSVDYLNKALPIDKVEKIINNETVFVNKYNISLSADGKYFIIPKALYQKQNININIDPALKEYLKEITQEGTNEKSIQIPVSIAIRHMQRKQGVDNIHILNIGDVKTEKEDLQLKIGKTLPKEWLWDKELADYTLDIQKSLNDKITALKNKYSLFPIEKVVVQNNKVTYYDKNNIAIADLTDIPLRKTVTIDGSVSPYTKVISDAINGEHMLIYKEQANIVSKYEIKTINRLTTSFEQAVTNIKSELKKLDNPKDMDFENFLASGISSRNIDQTAISLIKLLEKIPNYTINADITTLKTKLFSWTSLEKTQIVNHVKSIFADNYDGKFNNHSDVKGVLTWRGDRRKTISGPSSKVPTEIGIDDLRKQFIENNNYTPFDIPTDAPIFWYTARYRNGANQEAKNRSMTLPGYTNVLKTNKTYMSKIDENDTRPRDWFLSNFEKDIQEQQIFKNTLNAMLKTNTTLPQNLFDKLNRTKIKSLFDYTLDNKSNKIPNEVTIDINNKIYTIKLNVDRTFYLLKECANESIGFVPENIEITEKNTKPIEEKISVMPPMVGLRTNTTGTLNRANMAQKATREVNFTFVKQKPKEDKTTTEVVEEKDVTIEVQPEDQFVDNGDGSYTRIDGAGNQTIFIPDDLTAFQEFLNGTTTNNIFTWSELPVGDGTENERIQGNWQAPWGYWANSFWAGVGGWSEDLRKRKKN